MQRRLQGEDLHGSRHPARGVASRPSSQLNPLRREWFSRGDARGMGKRLAKTAAGTGSWFEARRSCARGCNREVFARGLNADLGGCVARGAAGAACVMAIVRKERRALTAVCCRRSEEFGKAGA